MVDLPVGEPEVPYIARWLSLKADSHLWGDGQTAQEFIRGALHPALAKDLYSSTSKVLVEQAAKSLIWVSNGFLFLPDPLFLRS